MANTTNIDLVKPLGTDHALISVINSNYDKIDTEAGNVRSNMALVQNTNTATEAIAKDQLVVWKGVLKKATSAIASGATLSASNLADTDIAVELAELQNQMTPENIQVSLSEYVSSNSSVKCYKVGRLCVVNLNVNILSTMVGSGNIATGCPNALSPGMGALVSQGTNKTLGITVTSSGVLRLDGTTGGATGWMNGNVVYITAS